MLKKVTKNDRESLAIKGKTMVGYAKKLIIASSLLTSLMGCNNAFILVPREKEEGNDSETIISPNPTEEIIGDWDISSGNTSIDTLFWGEDKIIERNVKSNYLIISKEDKSNGTTVYIRIDYQLTKKDTLRYCESERKSSLDEVKKIEPSNRKDIDKGGCGKLNEPWKKARRSIEIYGEWNNPETEKAVSIKNNHFKNAEVVYYDNQSKKFIVSKIVSKIGNKVGLDRYIWRLKDGDLYLCNDLKDQSDLNGVMEANVAVNEQDLTGGCNGNRWQHLKKSFKSISYSEFKSKNGTPLSISNDKTESHSVVKELPNGDTIVKESNNKYSLYRVKRLSWRTLKVCKINENQENEDEAKHSNVDKISNDSTNGCNNKPWQIYNKPFSLEGYWENQDQLTYFNDSNWDLSKKIISCDEDKKTIVYYDTTTKNKELYGKVKYFVDAQKLYTCELNGKKESILEANKDPEVTPDSTDLSTGCYGKPWKKYIKSHGWTGTLYSNDKRYFISAKQFIIGNDESTIVKQPSDSTFIIKNGTNTYSRIELAKNPNDKNNWILCISSSNKTSLAEAENDTASVDTTNLATGCNGAQWSKLSAIPLEGKWKTNFSSTINVTKQMFQDYSPSRIISFDAAKKELIVYTSTAWKPGFSKIVWIEQANKAGKKVHFLCTVSYGQDTANHAESASSNYDTLDPETKGCGPFSWTMMERVE